jgi:solute carrier family 35, member E1
MGSNIAAASRAVLAKGSMDRPKGTNMGPANLYAVLTMIATVILIPLAAVLEGPQLETKWKTAMLTSTADAIGKHAVLSGLWFYL